MKITGQMHFAKALQQLRRQGVELADVTSDELYGLAAAARRCADPFREVNADAAGFPVRVCEGVWFWKLTIGASVWLDEVEEMLGGGTSPRYRLAMIHALVHSREPEAFAGLDTENKVMRAVRATMRTIHATPEEVNRLDFNQDICLFSQTTKPLDGFQRIVNYISEHISPNATFTYYDTICRQVANRMPNIRAFATKHDVILFVCGQKSSNGRMLFDECKASNPYSYMIDSASEIQLDWLKDCKSVGICGATSTPKWLMEECKVRIKELLGCNE